MSLLTLGVVVVSLALLVVGAVLLVRGGSGLAATLRISPLVTGLTIVAFATSAPELAVSIQAASTGQTDIALGNVIGSNLFNILCVLGVSSLVCPLAVSRQLVRLDVPVMIGASILMFGLALDGQIGRLDGVLLSAGLVAYIFWSVREGRKEGNRPAPVSSDAPPARGLAVWLRTVTNLVFVAAGLAVLVFGANLLVEAAVELARALGVSELIVGLTIVATGTSLPELVTSVVAALRGERDIAVGNAVGSSTFNILSVLGLSSLVAPVGLDVPAAALRFDIPVWLAVSLVTLPILFREFTIARWEGALLCGYYLAYTTYLLLQASAHEALPAFSLVMGAFVIPITVLTVLVLAVLWARKGWFTGRGR